jgi:hypothetical protein
VKDYVRIARTRSREAFVPLAHPPGHAQVDFAECISSTALVRYRARLQSHAGQNILGVKPLIAAIQT